MGQNAIRELQKNSMLSQTSLALLAQAINPAVCYNTRKTHGGTMQGMKPEEGSEEYYVAARIEIGRKIKEARESQRLRAYEVAKKAGVSQPTITDIENGRKWSNLAIYGRICNALGLKLADLVRFLDKDDELTDEETMLIYELRQAILRQRPNQK
jgi:transcriptional regulator with XRE-family HTH domain